MDAILLVLHCSRDRSRLSRRVKLSHANLQKAPAFRAPAPIPGTVGTGVRPDSAHGLIRGTTASRAEPDPVHVPISVHGPIQYTARSSAWADPVHGPIRVPGRVCVHSPVNAQHTIPCIAGPRHTAC